MPLGEQLTRLSLALADRYTIERELGAGGMATVYLARDLRHQREVALKVLRPELTAILGAERFLNEIRITAQLDHPHILTLIDSGVSDGLLWYVIPFVRGETLRHKLAREQQLALPEVVKIAAQVAGALDYAHRRGVVHRDIKPENILFHEGEVVLADFGIALAVKEAGGQRLTETGLSLGTPQYMSPEQATGGRDVDLRSDVYSLGAVVYEMVAGEPPHTGATVQAIVAKLLTERPTRLTVVRDTTPERLDHAVAKALAKVPADRWQTAGEFAAALADAITDRAAPAPVNWRPWAFGGVAAVGLAAVIWFATRGGGQAAATAAPDRVQLTFTGNARNPAISPDGKRLAYVGSDCGDDGSCTSWLGIEDIGGGSTLKALAGALDLSNVAWSGSGRFITAMSTLGTTVAVSTLGGESRTLVSNASYGFPIPGTDTFVHGTSIGFQRLIFRSIADGRVGDSVPATGFGFAMPAPGGKRLLVMDGIASTVFRIVDRAGSVTDSLMFDVAGWRMGLARWLPNAAGVLSSVPRPGEREWEIVHHRVDPGGRVVGPPDTVLRQLPLMPLTGGFDLTADGRSMVYGAITSETIVWALERRDLGSTRYTGRRLFATTADAGALIDSAGGRVAFRRQVTGADRSGWQLFVTPFDSGQTVPVSPVLDRAPSFGWQSGQRSLVYTRQAPDARTDLYQVDLASGQETRVGTIAGTDARLWPLPGGGIVAVAAEGGRYQRVQVVARPAQRDTVFDLPSTIDIYLWSRIVPTPDGHALDIFTTVNREGNASRRSRLSLRDGSLVELNGGDFNNLLFLRWIGDSIEYGKLEGWGSGSWWRMSATGGPARRLGPVPFAPRGNDMSTTTHSFSADGRRGVAVQTIDRSDAFMIRNLDQLLRR